MILEVRLWEGLPRYEGKPGIKTKGRSSEQEKWALVSRQKLLPPPLPAQELNPAPPHPRRCQQLPGRGCLRGPLRVGLPACDQQRLQRPLQREPSGEHWTVRALRTELPQWPPGAVCVVPPTLCRHGSELREGKGPNFSNRPGAPKVPGLQTDEPWEPVGLTCPHCCLNFSLRTPHPSSFPCSLSKSNQGKKMSSGEE